jgi:hypothetical protein
MCNKFETNTKFLEYVDDVNILIYKKNIDENCRNLEKMHKLCERWAIRHEFVFVLIKYELIHFIKNSKKLKHDDHNQNRFEHDWIENQHSSSRRANRHTTEMRFTRTKNSRKNDETNHDFHEIVDLRLKSDFSQHSNVVHFRCSLDSHLRRLRLTHAQE